MDLTASFVPMSFQEQELEFWHRHRHATSIFIQGLVLWLFAMPAEKDLLVCFCRLLRRKPRNFWLEALKNTLTLLLILGPFLMMLALFGFVHTGYFGNVHIRTAVFAGGILILSVCNCLLASTLKTLLKRPGW